MTPVDFPEANNVFGPPPDLDETQCNRVKGWAGQAVGGSCDGVFMVVVAWKPSLTELAQLNAGAPIFLSSIGGLPPHFLTTSFEQATHPS